MTKKSLLELRLERLNRISNAKFEIVKRFQEGRSIWKRYFDGVLEVDMCIRIIGPSSTEYFSWKVVKLPGNSDFDEGTCLSDSADYRQMPMLVGVGNSSQGFRPCASLVRLEKLDGADVFTAQSRQMFFRAGIEAALFVFGMNFMTFDYELGSFRLPSGSVVDGKFVNEIIEGCTQVVNDLANENRNIFGYVQRRVRGNGSSSLSDIQLMPLRGCSLVLGEEFVFVKFSKPLDDSFQLLNVNIGSADSFVGTI